MVYRAVRSEGSDGCVSVEALSDCQLVSAVTEGTIRESNLHILILKRFRVMPFCSWMCPLSPTCEFAEVARACPCLYRVAEGVVWSIHLLDMQHLESKLGLSHSCSAFIWPGSGPMVTFHPAYSAVMLLSHTNPCWSRNQEPWEERSKKGIVGTVAG